jgi:hypothetical protein
VWREWILAGIGCCRGLLNDKSLGGGVQQLLCQQCRDFVLVPAVAAVICSQCLSSQGLFSQRDRDGVVALVVHMDQHRSVA